MEFDKPNRGVKGNGPSPEIKKKNADDIAGSNEMGKTLMGFAIFIAICIALLMESSEGTGAGFGGKWGTGGHRLNRPTRAVVMSEPFGKVKPNLMLEGATFGGWAGI